jgi:hypothetical protein
MLGAALTSLRSEVQGMPDRVARFRPAPGEWCALNVIGHLSEAERRGFAGRIGIILAEDDPTFTGWDPDEVARARADHEKDPAAVLAEFAALREASVRLVARLTAADLARGGTHPQVGRLTVADLLHEWVHHDRNHLAQIGANVQACAWPHMGNSQRFSAPSLSTGDRTGIVELSDEDI